MSATNNRDEGKGQLHVKPLLVRVNVQYPGKPVCTVS
jgi:hypothetical protein